MPEAAGEILGLVAVAVVAAGGWFAIGAAFALERPEAVFLQRVFVVSIAVRVALAVGTYHLLPYGDLAPDEAGYMSSAKQIVGAGVVNLGQVFNGEGWQYFNALLFYVFGDQPLLPRLWNSVLGSAVPILVYAIARRLGAGAGARWSAALAALFPSLVLWSSLNLKDADVWFLLLCGLLLALRMQESVRLRDLLLAALTLAALWPLRQYTVVAVALAVIAGLASGNRHVRELASKSASGVKVGFPLAAAVTLACAGAVAIFYGAVGPRLAHLRHALAQGAHSATNPDPGIATLTGALSFLPAGLRDFFLRPFPWEAGTSLLSLARPETVAYYICLAVSAAGLARALRSRAAPAIPLITFLVVAGAGYTLVLANLGTIYRERDQLLVVLLAFVGVGVDAVGLARVQGEKRAAKQPE